MATSSAPPPLHGPTAKEKKYDRQLRLWAAAGQQALEEAHVLLLNGGAGVVGIETLKNLVLPGVGNFTIVDERMVQEEDLGVNFFLEESSLGRSRAEECCKFLQELNPEVKGYAVQESIEDFISQPDSLTRYTLILLVSPVKHPSILQRLSEYAWSRSIALFYIHCYGFYSEFSLQLPSQFPIVDTHPDPASTQDLRLLNPWPELLDLVHAKTDDLANLSDYEHGHIPYLLLLLHYLESWKASHDGKSPENYKEKSAFRDFVRKGIRKNSHEGGEENYDEAIGAVLKSIHPLPISSGLRAIFEDEECQNLEHSSSNFHLLTHALHNFHKTHAVLPLPGTVPDMKSQPPDYIALQNVYKAKSRADIAELTTTVRTLEKQLSRSHSIPNAEIEAFAKNAASIKLIRGSPLRIATSEASKMHFGDRAGPVLRELGDDESLIPLYLCFLALDAYLATGASLPSLPASSSSQDVAAAETAHRKFTWHMTQYTDTLVESIKKGAEASGVGDVDAKIGEERIGLVIREMARAGGAELHNISALTGGMVAQEVIKVVTRQYVPVEGVCVFDGVVSRVGVFDV